MHSSLPVLPGADTTANDGIYSGYFVDLRGPGRYGVTVEVLGGPGTRLAIPMHVSSGPFNAPAKRGV